ncbi:MAG: tetratricopeptide repeat protein [Planctomycetota bacterium]|jgi:tetratricopeptide (TPR) repeat protein
MLARGTWLKTALVVAVIAGSATDALARGSRKQTGSYETIGLAALRANPKAFIGKRLSFDCFFAGLGRIYQPFQTPFVAEQYLNFHVWEPGTKLWDNKDRRNAFLFCFLPRDLDKQTNYIMKRQTYETIRIFGRVTVVYADHPWFEVDDVEASAMPSISETALKHIMVGIKSVRNGQFGMAEKSFAEAVGEGLPVDAQNFAQRELGGTYYELGKYEEAADAFEQAARLGKGDAWVSLRLGQSLSRAADADTHAGRKRQKLNAAKGHLENARKRDPSNPDVHAEIGWVKAKLGDPGEGIRHVKDAIALKANAPSYRILGRIYVQLGRLNDADSAYGNAISRDPTSPIYHREVADLVYMPQGRYADAESEYRNLTTEVAKTDPEGYLKLAEALLKQGKDDDAKLQYDAIIRQDRDNIEALLGRAAILRDKEDYENADVDLGLAERLAPKDARVQVARVEVLQAKGDYGRAVDACNTIIKGRLTKDLAPIRYALGVSLLKKPKPEPKLAIAQLQIAAKLDRGNVDYRKALAEAMIEMGQFAGAVREFQQLKKSSPGDERIRLLLAHAMVEAGSYPAAQAELEQVVQDMPDSVWAKNNLAYLLAEYARTPDLDRAAKLANAANARAAGNPVFQDTLGWIKFKQGDEDARTFLDMAIINSKQAEPYYHRAFVVREADPELARDDIEEALRRLLAQTGRGVATRKLLADAQKLAKQLGASLNPGPRE